MEPRVFTTFIYDYVVFLLGIRFSPSPSCQNYWTVLHRLVGPQHMVLELGTSAARLPAFLEEDQLVPDGKRLAGTRSAV